RRPLVPHHVISPNLHVILIHYPLGLIIAGILIELFSFLWRRSGFRAAGRWMILIGVASAIPAATSGMYALYDVMGDQMGTTLKDMKNTAPLNDHQWHMIRDHVTWNAIDAGAALGKTLHAIKKPVEKLADMVDVHVIAAGWTVALALIALGLSIRATTAGSWTAGDYRGGSATENEIARAFSAPADVRAAA